MDWTNLWDHMWHLLVAFGLVLPLGWDRERAARSAGLRTFPLVAVATCGFVLVGMTEFDGDDARARIIYGTITGLGFLGGGAILKNNEAVHGMTTAASLWNTGAVGIAVAANQFTIAVLLAGINFLLLRLKHWLPEEVHHHEDQS
ncbi:MAG: MgtC/SapB family protein [Phycisphaeraceae bacterium]|nr:MgtC/SapB family protein [Phycisphaeraceae bacterium]